VCHAVAGQNHAPVGEVLHGGFTDGLFEAEGEGGAGHAGGGGEFLECPAAGRFGVDGVDGGAHLRVSECEQPTDAAAEAFGEVQAQGVDKHHGDEMLGDESAAGLRVAEFLHEAFEGEAHGGLIGRGADVNDGGKGLEEDVGVGTGELEAAANAKAATATVDAADGTLEGEIEEGVGVGGRKGEVAGEDEGTAEGEDETVSAGEADGFGNAIDGEPAVAGDEGVALDSLGWREADGPVATHVKAAAHVVAEFKEREDVREGIHRVWDAREDNADAQV
jgi:hypothetical protein